MISFNYLIKIVLKLIYYEIGLTIVKYIEIISIYSAILIK